MRISVPLPLGEALVLYECLDRYHKSGKPELVTDRVEWRVLIDVLGELERRMPIHYDHQKELARARHRLADPNDAPF
jgi:hypothetical protein